MMSTEVQPPVKVDELEKSGKRRSGPIKRSLHISHKKFKADDPTKCHFRFCRKRAHSLGNGKFFPPHKKRKKVIPPTKFLLGGNIHDPLNLNSLQDEEVNRAMNAVTPESSPLPTPQHRKGKVEVIIPANIHDPLNLADCQEDSDSIMTTPFKKMKKKHKRKRQRSFREDLPESKSDESKTEESLVEVDLVSPEPPKAGEEVPKEAEWGEEETVKEGEPKKEVTKPATLEITPAVVDFKKPKRSLEETPPGSQANASRSSSSGTSSVTPLTFRPNKDKIVSPVIPQPGAWHLHRKSFRPVAKLKTPNFKETNSKFRYGNYNRYYGYRNPHHEPDPRMKLLNSRRNLFEDKDILDIGCNSGDVTLSIARELGPRSITGLDLDRGLIDTARANLKHHLNKTNGFPAAMQAIYGTIGVPGVSQQTNFPNNVSFINGNYVLQSDVLLELEKPQFDVILCLSVTKWIQLNWGDDGLKRVFKRIYAQLRPGGCLILEPQPYSSYKKKKKAVTEEMWKNFKGMQLFPTMFSDYLLKDVGFTKSETLGHPLHPSAGFQRTIKIFTKEAVRDDETPQADPR